MRKERKQQGHSGKGFFPSGHRGYIEQFFTRRLGINFNTRFQKIVRLGKHQIALTAAKKRLVNIFKVHTHLFKRIFKVFARGLVNFINGGL